MIHLLVRDQRYRIILVQIRFLKTRYLGQHNEDGPLINPIIPLDDPGLAVLRAYGRSSDVAILDSKINPQKKEKGNLIS